MALGNSTDIRDYFNDRKTYALDLQEIEVVNISKSSAAEKLKLLAEKRSLEERLEYLNKKIK